jgi:hypothetical protein
MLECTTIRRLEFQGVNLRSRVPVFQDVGFECGSMNEARCNTIGACCGGVYVCKLGSIGAVGTVAGSAGCFEPIVFGTLVSSLC